MTRSHLVLLRDLVIFQVKLVLDGIKDIVLAPVSIGAAVVDLLLPGRRLGHRFYAVMEVGERYDQWLNLFGEARAADAHRDGLFGGRPGAGDGGSGDDRRDSLLTQLEELAAGR
jgi:hypothetical protein